MTSHLRSWTSVASMRPGPDDVRGNPRRPSHPNSRPLAPPGSLAARQPGGPQRDRAPTGRRHDRVRCTALVQSRRRRTTPPSPRRSPAAALAEGEKRSCGPRQRHARDWANAQAASPAPADRSAPLVAREPVAQTNAPLDFSCACDKVTIFGRTFSAAADPLGPPETLSRGRRNRPLCNSYKGFGLCDSLTRERKRAARSDPDESTSGPSARAHNWEAGCAGADERARNWANERADRRWCTQPHLVVSRAGRTSRCDRSAEHAIALVRFPWSLSPEAQPRQTRSAASRSLLV